MPPRYASQTFKQAPRAKTSDLSQLGLVADSPAPDVPDELPFD
jgi:hypothetical protein